MPAADDNGVQAGGDFTQANVGADLAADRLARWDGSTWSDLGSGISGRVCAAARSGGNPFVGDAFGTTGGRVSANIGHNATSDRIFVEGFETPQTSGKPVKRSLLATPRQDDCDIGQGDIRVPARERVQGCSAP